MEQTARERGVTPQELADEMGPKFEDYFKEIGISHDDFVHTRQPRHVAAVTKLVEQLQANDDVYQGNYSGWYDVGQEEFVTETNAKAQDYKSAVSGRPLERHEESTYLFRLTKYLPKLIEHIEQHPEFIQPAARRNKILTDLNGGDFGDLSITRSSLKWGTPMPGDPSHVLYVWVDALPNYATVLGYNSDDTTRFDKFWPADVHLIGKEILWFHTVYWPCILMSLGLPLPKQVFAHGWWTSEGKKMSKSMGNFIGLDELRRVTDYYGLDALRYYLLRAAPFGSDLDWQADELHRAYLELANVLGNGLNRVLKMTGKYRDGALPDAEAAASGREDEALLEASNSLSEKVTSAWTSLELQSAATLAIDLVREMNGYIDRTEPFKLAKDELQAARLDAVLHHAAIALYRALIALLPVLPDKAAAGLKQMNVNVEGRTFADLMANPAPARPPVRRSQPALPAARPDASRYLRARTASSSRMSAVP